MTEYTQEVMGREKNVSTSSVKNSDMKTMHSRYIFLGL